MNRIRLALVMGAILGYALAPAAHAANLDLLGVKPAETKAKPVETKATDAKPDESGPPDTFKAQFDDKTILLRIRAECGHPDFWKKNFSGETREAQLTGLKVTFRSDHGAGVEGFLVTTIEQEITEGGRACIRIRREKWGLSITVVESQNVPFHVDYTSLTTRQVLEETVIPKR